MQNQLFWLMLILGSLQKVSFIDTDISVGIGTFVLVKVFLNRYWSISRVSEKNSIDKKLPTDKVVC